MRTESIYPDTTGKPAFLDAYIIAVHSRAHEILRLEIMANGSELFSNVPLPALTNDRQSLKLSEQDSVWSILSDPLVSICVLETLKTSNPTILKKDGSVWQNGSYELTVECERVKEQLHLILLDDGNYVFWGNDGLRWGEE